MSDIPIPPNVSGQIMAQGISGATANIGDALTQYAGILKQTKAYRQMAVDGLGMDPDEVDKMSLPALQGKMQGIALKSQQQERQAQIGEMMARSKMWSSTADEADAFGQLAPAAASWQKANPGKAPTGLDVLQMMGGSKIGPRAQGMILSRLLPSIMGNGENGQTPTPWTSPTGNPYVTFGKELIPDRSVDINSLMQNAPTGETPLPNGKGGVTWRNTNKTLPSTYATRLSNSAGNGIVDQLSLLQQTGNQSDEDLLAKPTINGDKTKLATFRKNNTAQVTALQKQLKNHLDSYAGQGYATPDFWAGEYQRYGLTPPAGTPAASRDVGSPGGVSAPAGASGTRVPVWDKTGKQFTVPAEQKDDAVAQGYLLAAPSQ